MRSCTAAIAVLLALAGSPTVAWAQAGWYVTPTLTLTQEYDDNVFGSSSNKKSDFISRATPGVTAGYQSTPFTILGSYAFDAEYFADLSDLTDVGHRQRGELEIRYRPDPRLTLSFSGAYTLSKTTSEFLVSPTTAPAAASQAPASQTPAGQPQATQPSATQQAPAQEPITPGGPTVSGVNGSADA